MKILITGGLGFQGSHLAEYFLGAGHRVTVLNTISDRAFQTLHSLKKKPAVVWGSVTDYEVVRKTMRGQDVVFHLAAYVNVDESLINPHLCFDVNIGGTVNILEAAREYGVRVIHASTCEVYGASPQGTRITEESVLQPHSPYASSKAAADRICFSYFKSYGLNVAIVRPFNIFGSRQKEGEFGALIPILVRRALAKENLVVFGKGLQTRDYMHIIDLVTAYDLVMRAKNTAGEVFNFATGRDTKIKDIVHYVADYFKVSVRYAQARPGEVAAFYGTSAKAEAMLGFKPKIDIWKGIDRYIAWRTKQ